MSDRPATVLLIEDNPGDARLIREMLAEGGGDRFKLECADRLSTGLERLAEGGVDIVLLDLGLPDSQGLDTLHKVIAEVPEVPITVVLTGTDDEELASSGGTGGCAGLSDQGADREQPAGTRHALRHGAVSDTGGLTQLGAD